MVSGLGVPEGALRVSLGLGSSDADLDQFAEALAALPALDPSDVTGTPAGAAADPVLGGGRRVGSVQAGRTSSSVPVAMSKMNPRTESSCGTNGLLQCYWVQSQWDLG